ncbi:Ubiquitin-like protein [Glarea lozoyensis ATCC 20868]|uniref:Ubiquitin-like protein n=1 Tax=Glarea lozoyensis (strain ATCC 20868 / MF5171) TaxID=1116229 RepID=S3DHI6_GLAL2|nr:Ubiquitin-like protein [Glarea lozoyensis ATCC 20868]EPE31501.1 Ubiquitin-like protein [Glarea lozoyensis ATCC 20868]
MATFVSSFLAAANGLKSILTTQDFGSDYELLCTELSLQSLRFRLWGESVGIHVDFPERTQAHTFTRAEIQGTITQAVNSVIHLLADVEALRHRYDLKSTRISTFGGSRKSSITQREAGLTATDYQPSGVTLLRERMEENQQQKSFLSLAKWTRTDAKKFEEKIARLKSLIDSMESISKVAELTSAITSPILPNYTPTTLEEGPPAYTERQERPVIAERSGSSDWPLPSPRLMEVQSRSPRSRRPRLTSIYSSQSSDIVKHHTAFVTYVAGIDGTSDREASPRARDKLQRLSSVQFSELSSDIYDEVVRRQEYNAYVYHDIRQEPRLEMVADTLPEKSDYHPKRNAARQRLATLRTQRFRDLVNDMLVEIERRSSLPPPPTSGISYQSLSALSSPNILSPVSTTGFSAASTPATTPSNSPPTTPELPSVEVFKSFRVSPNSTTNQVLPEALRKYHIKARWQDYQLWIMYGDQERCLGPEERPLSIFRELERDGKKPMFMLKSHKKQTTGASSAKNEGFTK